MQARMDSRELLARLAAFDTVSSRSNLALIEFVRDYLAGYGVESRLIGNAAGDKANLLASIGPPRAGGVVLSGHTDVVPVEGQAWSGDPFRLQERDGRLYARGACDMKGFIACVLAAVPEMVAAPLSSPVHLAFSYDEEIGCLGAPGLIAEMQRRALGPRAVIVGEPTSMRVVDSHKGVMVCRTRVSGQPAHSSQPHRGVSAVALAARLVTWLADAAEGRLRAGTQDPRFEPPWSTLTINRIEGGTAVNILAGHCEFTWDFRCLPQESPDSLLRDFHAFSERLRREVEDVAPAASIATDEIVAPVPPLRAELRSEAAALAAELTGAARREAVAYATEGGQFQQAGFSTVVCGPGSIDQAHRPDEFIELSELARCDEVLRGLIRRQCSV